MVTIDKLYFFLYSFMCAPFKTLVSCNFQQWHWKLAVLTIIDSVMHRNAGHARFNIGVATCHNRLCHCLFSDLEWTIKLWSSNYFRGHFRSSIRQVAIGKFRIKLPQSWCMLVKMCPRWPWWEWFLLHIRCHMTLSYHGSKAAAMQLLYCSPGTAWP